MTVDPEPSQTRLTENQRFRRRRGWRAVALSVCASALLVTCGEPREARPGPAKFPVSIRGWVSDIDLPPQETMQVIDPAVGDMRKWAVIGRINLYVEAADYVSGGIANDGSFIMLDVPPGEVNLIFQPPGLPDGRLHLENVPPNADILLPDLAIKGGSVLLNEPELAMVRIPAKVSERRKLESTVRIAGHEIPAWEVPLQEMIDRREYPERNQSPGIAVVK